MRPPTRSPASSTTTSAPRRLRQCAAALPAIPDPITATRLPLTADGRGGGLAPVQWCRMCRHGCTRADNRHQNSTRYRSINRDPTTTGVTAANTHKRMGNTAEKRQDNFGGVAPSFVYTQDPVCTCLKWAKSIWLKTLPGACLRLLRSGCAQSLRLVEAL